MKKWIIAGLLLSGSFLHLGNLLFAQNSDNQVSKSLDFEASLISDFAYNFAGGIKTGGCYLGMANIRMNFDLEKAGLWSGGQFFLNGVNTHGATPSSDIFGDIQVVSNIDAGNHTYLQEFWFRQELGKLEFTIGLQDMNLEFANSEQGSLFLNSSFGILPVISGNINSPIFPLTALGLTVKVNLSENTSWINAIYDGSPTDFDYNPYNVKWEFISGDGLLAISEFQYQASINQYPGTYKFGMYSHSHIVETSLGHTLPDSLNNHFTGFYSYMDQYLWKQNHKSLAMFAQLGYSPSKQSTHDFYFGLGMNYSGLFSKKGSDVLGLAIAQVHFKEHNKSETVLELSYKYQLTYNIFIQPDVQYIINPLGTGKSLRNCMPGILRLGINF